MSITMLHRLLVLCAVLAPVSAMPAASYPDQPIRGAGVVCVSDSGVICLDRRSGNTLWSALESEHTLEPVLASGRLLVAGASGLHAFDPQTGELHWQWRSGGMVFPPTVAEGVVYASDELGHFAALDLASGAPVWRRRFDGWSYPPAVIGDSLVTGGQRGIVRGLDPASGATRWQRSLSQELVYRPVATNGLAVVTTFDGRIVAFGADGEVVWRARDPVASLSPTVSREVLVFGGMDGRLRARAPADGRLLWTRRLGDVQLDRPAHFDPTGDRIALLTPDRSIALLDTASGQVLRRIDTPVGVMGSPLHLPDRGWTVVLRRAGTFSLWSLSHLPTDE